jgi:hypothetical protein
VAASRTLSAASVNENVAWVIVRLRAHGAFDDTLPMFASDQGCFLDKDGLGIGNRGAGVTSHTMAAHDLRGFGESGVR